MRFKQSPLLLWMLISTVAFGADKIVLSDGSINIHQSDIRRAASSFVPPEQMGSFFADEKKVRETIVRILVQKKLAEEATARVLDPEELMSVEDARSRALTQVQLEHLLKQRVAPDFDALAKESYLANRDKYLTPRKVKVEHILIDTKSRSNEEAKTKADELFLIVKKNATPFGELALQHSDDPSASRNKGDLGFFAKGSMVKPFEEAAFAMSRKGELAGPVKTDFGYHIIRFIEDQPDGVMPFDSVKDRLVKEEKAKFRSRVLSEEYERVSKSSTPTVDQDAINEMIFRFQPASKR